VSEGWLRKLQSQEQKIDENDRFGLLLMNGRDLVGAVTIVPLATESDEQ
jgi:serine/threonine-protein kinase HipA